ncbi:MAG: SHOCT domain-containing protein [Actinomycetota bacterium]|nr:SHOCT domain-containing protein [Actinomycetota bacterium]
MMGWWGGDWGGWMIFMAVLWVVLIVAGVWAVMALTRGNRPWSGSAESPKEILDRRLASGEIDVEEYERLRRALGLGT